MFRLLEEALEARRVELRLEVAGAEPEMVLVLEVAGSVERFARAIRDVDGLEWLAEFDDEDLEIDDDFYLVDGDRVSPAAAELFLVMTNHRALQELLSLWRSYIANPDMRFPRGQAPLRHVFDQLKAVRTWGVEDRLLRTGVLSDWMERLAEGGQSVRFEAELWFREEPEARERALSNVTSLVTSEGGNVAYENSMTEIRYHAVLGELPITSVERIVSAPDTRLVRSDDVMFFRPVGQARTTPWAEEPTPISGPEETPRPQGNPVIALLDGMPLETHAVLRDRLLVDDPEDWAATYPAAERQHGTAMASLIVHGELDQPDPPLGSPLYVRPIMRPDPRSWAVPRRESIPDHVLPVDLLSQAITRIKLGVFGSPPAAPSVRIVNLSIGDPARAFDGQLSPLARLIDWLSWTHGVLFVVSAGNHNGDLRLSAPVGGIAGMPPEEMQRQVIEAVLGEAHLRSILSPAEAMNALTVGAAHSDKSGTPPAGPRVNPLINGSLPSPISRLGHGFRRSVKPDILMPGGRQMYEEQPGGAVSQLTVGLATAITPGQRVATPGVPGELAASRWTCGSSNAAALVSGAAGRLVVALEAMTAESGGAGISDRAWPAILKALLVHASAWGEATGPMSQVVAPLMDGRQARSAVTRFLGYGRADTARVFGSTDQRATLLGWDEIAADETHVYRIPLPPSLSEEAVWRRLTVTLAWQTPINPRHRRYRVAALSFDPPRAELAVDRQDVQWYAARRGTVQHEVLEGERASVFEDGTELVIEIACRADAGDLTEQVPYSLAITLEVAPEIALPIYDEIRQRIQVPVRVSGRP